ncbi:LysR family transcriptional regulator [Tabrizicola sp.]|uniref:LysR family transcriptional regulator n=1 Tax=Tabrizicola sp. TaxID=2005166 RepID=UPI003F3103B1
MTAIMDMNQIRYFVALAETLSFTKAAEKCDVTQPTMSRGIKLLEQRLGGQLLRRERGRTHLTELGHNVLRGFQTILVQLDAVQAEAEKLSTPTRATLKLGIMCTIGPGMLIPIISHLATRAPQLNIELLEAPVTKIIDMLSEGHLDVALVGAPKYPEILSITPLYDERYVVAFPRGHRFEKMDAVPVTELNGEPYLERLNCEYVLHYNESEGPFEISPDVRYKSEHEDWIQAMILAGMGCACMPEYMALFPELMRRPLTSPEINRTISLATVRGRRHTPAIGLFVRLSMEFHRNRRAIGT